MDQTDWDIVIIGGGLAGLSLAVEFAQPACAHLRVLVLEKRSHYVRDRTWSYWATQTHRYSALERLRWNKWRVSFEGQQTVQTSSVAYCTIDADAFYEFAQSQIADAPNLQLCMNADVSKVVEGERPTVHLADGSTVSASWVMDARPLANHRAGALCQHFSGWEIHTATDCFNDSTVELMDFQRAGRGLHFFYVLPYGPRNALIESTWISTDDHQPDYAGELKDYLSRRYGVTSAEPVYSEQGRLDLQIQTGPAAAGRLLALGRRAGTLRPSTGFAFLETIADARRIASFFKGVRRDSMAAVLVTPYKRAALDVWMDKVFLQTMRSDWQRAPEFFMAMFKGVKAETLVAFLSGNSAPMQRLQVSLQLPKLPFIRTALRNIYS
jgi:lycopene beta-cyclase